VPKHPNFKIQIAKIDGIFTDILLSTDQYEAAHVSY
jgi:hypothetical protein